MNIQEIIVYLIIVGAVLAIVRYAYRQVAGKAPSCNCGSCPKSGGECHCHDHCDTQK